ncbi:MAG: hypothetical protein FGM14_04395 [Flavobacteriales bacterium]|nr:hypothetical protein [Flavobacteriales bacterium]
MISNYFSFIDIFSAILWYGILSVIVNRQSKNITNEELKPYYVTNFNVKVVYGLAFTIIYLTILGGGDTKAYWDGAAVLNKLFFKSPGLYLDAISSAPTNENRLIHFNSETGFPPGWIYREAQGWFISQITSVVSIFTFRSYFATVIIFAYFVSRATWKIFELVTRLNLHTIRIAAWCMLYVPSVGFWCTGISKDTVIFVSILNILYYVLDILILKNKIRLKHIIGIFFFVFLITQIRSFALAATFAPLLAAFGTRLTNKYSSNLFAKFSFRIVFLGVGTFGFLMFFSSSVVAELAQEAAVVQGDFKNNLTYTGKKYDIGVVDGTPAGMIRAFPISVFYGVYKPFIYEALSPTLILNGIESLILVVMTLNFFFVGNVLKKIKRVRSNEFLIFAFVFTLLIGFMAGYTSVLYGVLVRIRAPLLPFLFLIFTTKPEEIKQPEENLLTEKV